MRVIVLGGTGFLGAALVQRLIAHGHFVSVFHRGPTRPNLPDSVEYVLGNRYNLPNYSEHFKSFAPEIVIDAVAATRQQTHTLMHVFRGKHQNSSLAWISRVGPSDGGFNSNCNFGAGTSTFANRS